MSTVLYLELGSNYACMPNSMVLLPVYVLFSFLCWYFGLGMSVALALVITFTGGEVKQLVC